MASHTLDNDEYNSLISGREAAEREANNLKIELARVRNEDPANRIAPLNELARSMLEIVRFAVANLNPESTRSWPAKALERVATLMPAMTDFTSADDGVLAHEFRAFAGDCREYAQRREEARQAKLDADAAAPKGDIAALAPTENAP